MDIRLQTSWVTHPKIIKLERRLGEPAVLALIRLWTWCGSSKTSGVLDGMAVDDIELAAQWSGDDGALVPVLVSLRLLDVDDDTYIIHDWEANNPWASGQNARSESARNAALARWGNGKTENIEPCEPHQSAMRNHAGRIKNDANRIKNDAGRNAESCGAHQKRCEPHQSAMRNHADASIRNAPSPSPSPSPSPIPKPHTTTRDAVASIPHVIPSDISNCHIKNTHKPQRTEPAPIHTGKTYFRITPGELANCHRWASENKLGADYVESAISEVDDWMSGESKAAKDARKSPTHCRYISQSWVQSKVAERRRATAMLQRPADAPRFQKPKTIAEKNAEFFEQFEIENGLRPAPAQPVNVGTNVSDVEIIYPNQESGDEQN